MDMEAADSRPATKGDIESLRRDHGGRMGGLDGRMDKLDGRMDKLDGRMDKLDHRMDKLDQRVGVVEKKLDRVIVEVVRTQADVREIKANMANLATKDDIRNYVGTIQDFAAKVERSDRARILHGQALTEGQVTLKDHERRLRTLES
ncbi:MAG: hypothetical protein HKL90_06330 [Elusimicrobia bacterium]|nr:hypothetical protein [Elusimicrobiota bacterium]